MQLTTAQKHKQNVFGKNFPKIGNRSGKVDAVWKTVDKQQQKLCDFGKKRKWQKKLGEGRGKKGKMGQNVQTQKEKYFDKIKSIHIFIQFLDFKTY